MSWQTYTAITIVTLTLLIFLIRFARPKKSGHCGHGCGCDKKHE